MCSKKKTDFFCSQYWTARNVTAYVNDECDAPVDFYSTFAPSVYRWFLVNDLLLNGDKCEAIVIGTAAQLKSVAAMKAVTVAGTSLPLSHELKSLGVTLDDHLRFDSHVRAVAKVCTFHTPTLPRTAHAVHRARRNDWVQHRRVASRLL